MGERRVVLFALGVFIGAAAVAPPVELRSDQSLTWHMAQHLLMLLVVPALVVLGLGDRLTVVASTPVFSAVIAVHLVVLVGWHVPALYGAAERNAGLHVVEHLSFLLAGFGLWALVVSGSSHWSAPVLLFIVGLPGTLLGAAMTLAGAAWYSAYPSVPSQQLAGVVMWSGAGLGYLVGAAGATARLLTKMTQS